MTEIVGSSCHEIVTLQSTKLNKVLAPIRDFADAVSGEKKVTISCVQPVLCKIFAVLAVTDKDGALAEEMKQVLAEDLKTRYVDDRVKVLLDCATFLDVRFKDTFVGDSNKVKQKLLRDIETTTLGGSGCLSSTDQNPAAASCDLSTSELESGDEGPAAKRKKPGSGLKDLLVNIRKERKDEITASTSTANTSSAA